MVDIGKLLAPRSMAVIGGALAGQGLRGRILETLLGHPFKGSIHPVSRTHGEVQGRRAYPSIGEVPGPVDCAVLIIPAKFVAEELERCGKAGVGAAIILSSGFAEEPGDAGARMQAEIRRIAERYGMAVMGPNSEGYANLPLALCPTFSPALAPSDTPPIPRFPLGNRRVSVVAQSGGMGFGFFDRGRPKELGFNLIVTTGNEAALEALDYADHLIDDAGTDVLLMLIEDIKTGAKLGRLGEKALKAGKPIIVSKIGQSDAGARAAASHTAALAGSYASFSGVARHYGLIEARDAEEMVDIAQGFLAAGPALPTGRRIGICTASGGGGGWMADACIAASLEVPTLDAATRKTIDAHLPPYGTSQNPVDGTAQAIRSVGYGGLARLVDASPVIDAIVVVMSGRNPAHIEHEREALIQVRKEARKPILMWSYTLPHPRTVEILSEAGYPIYTNMRNVPRALAEMAGYRAFRERFLARPTITTTSPAAKERVAKAMAAADGALTEAASRPLLAEYGIGSLRGQHLVQTAEEAARAAASIGGPVALKVQSAGILHKTEVGALSLALEGADTIRAAYERIMTNARRHAPGATIDGVLVQPMAAKGREVIVGISRDATFGPMLMVGLGGIHVEVLGDVAFAPVPLGHPEALALIATLAGRALLDAQRGMPAADVDALADLMVRLSSFAADHADTIGEIDLNPVIVHAAGDGITIADALIVPRSKP